MVGGAGQFQQFTDLRLGLNAGGFALPERLPPRVPLRDEFLEAVVAVFADVIHDGSGHETSEVDEQHEEGDESYNAALRDVDAQQLAHRCRSFVVVGGHACTAASRPQARLDLTAGQTARGPGALSSGLDCSRLTCGTGAVTFSRSHRVTSAAIAAITLLWWSADQSRPRPTHRAMTAWANCTSIAASAPVFRTTAVMRPTAAAETALMRVCVLSEMSTPNADSAWSSAAMNPSRYTGSLPRIFTGVSLLDGCGGDGWFRPWGCGGRPRSWGRGSRRRRRAARRGSSGSRGRSRGRSWSSSGPGRRRFHCCSACRSRGRPAACRGR